MKKLGTPCERETEEEESRIFQNSAVEELTRLPSYTPTPHGRTQNKKGTTFPLTDDRYTTPPRCQAHCRNHTEDGGGWRRRKPYV
jgi:hypothetical protein